MVHFNIYNSARSFLHNFEKFEKQPDRTTLTGRIF